MVIQTQKHTIE